MATLADVLKGYIPPSESALADPIKRHIASLPQKFEENQAAQMAALQKAFPDNTLANADPKAMAEMAMQVPLVGMTTQTRKQLIEKLVEDYRGSHVAPNAKVYGGTLDALENIMPKDVYSQQGKRLYGIGDPAIDHEWYMAAMRSKGNPEALVDVYRAVPKGVKDINHGDWVTTSKKYANNHGENALNGEYEILSKKVKANTLSSEGYPYEFGYHE